MALTAATSGKTHPASRPGPTVPPVKEGAGGDTFVTTDYDAELDREHAEAQAAPGGAELEQAWREGQPPQARETQPPRETPKPAEARETQAPPATKETQAPPAEARETQAPPPTETPAGEKPSTLDANEVLHITPEAAMSRGEVLKYLQTYNAIIPELEAFRQTFGMTGDVAQKSWSPILTVLRQNKEGGGKLDEIINRVVELDDGGEFEDYMLKCADSFKSWREQNPTEKPAKREAQVDTETRNRIASVEQQLRQQQFEQAKAYVEKERAALSEQYPVLADQDTWNRFSQGAFIRSSTDPNWTLTREAELQKKWLKDMQAFHDWQSGKTTTTTPETKTHVPALVTGGGAAPGATRDDSVNANQEIAFPDLNDAVTDWVKNREKLGFTD